MATIDIDWELLYEENGNTAWEFDPSEYPVTPELVNQIGAQPNVTVYDYSFDWIFRSNELKNLSLEEGNFSDKWFWFKSTQLPEPIDLVENRIELVDGRSFNEDEMNALSNAAIISREFAELNRLAVGSKMSFFRTVYKDSSLEGAALEASENIHETLTLDIMVVGIFEPVKNETWNVSENIEEREAQLELDVNNTIYIANKTLESFSERIKTANSKYGKIVPEEVYNVPVSFCLFVLNDPREAEAFRDAATPLLPQYNRITISSDFYRAIVAPMQSMKWISTMILIVAVVASLIILSLLITLFLRDRRQEIGIYLSLGEKRRKVIFQVAVEVLAIAVLAISLSLLSGNRLSESIAERMISDQAIAAEKQVENNVENPDSVLLSWGYGKEITADTIIQNYDISLDSDVIMIIYAAGIGIIILSIILPIVYLIRLRPKKILME